MAPTTYQSPIWEILEAMTCYGGGFVKELAMLYRLADHENRVKLVTTFEHYFVQYDEMARMAKRDAGE